MVYGFHVENIGTGGGHFLFILLFIFTFCHEDGTGGHFIIIKNPVASKMAWAQHL